MEAKYFKKYYDSPKKEIMVIDRLHKGKCISVYNDRVQIFDTLTEDYLLRSGYKKATAEEFDTFYMATMKNFDEILNP